MLGVLGLLAAALGPALFWLWFAWRRDRYEAEPRGLVLTTFLLGGLATIPAAIAENVLDADVGDGPATVAGLAVSTLLIVGPVEEVVKFLVVWAWAYRKRAFNEPMDGLVYVAAAAMGFAGVENVAYVIGNGPAIMLVRGPISTLAHLLFALPYGLALGRAKLGRAGPMVVVAALAFAATGHGLYDLFLSLPQTDSAWGLLILMVGPLVAYLWRRGSRAFRQADAESPFRRGSGPL